MNLKKKVQHYWDKQPCNIKNSKKKYLSKEFFNEIKKNKYFVEKHIPNFAQFKKFKNKNVLEIGFGIGTDASEFIKNGANYFGVEFSKHSLKIAKKRFEIFNYKQNKYKLFYGDAENLSKIRELSKIKFDLIYSFGVLHHTPNLKKCFQEIHKVSRKKTIIRIMLYAKNSYKNFLLDHTHYRYEKQKNCPVVKTIDDHDLKILLNNKFKIIRIHQDFIFPYKINPYKNGKYIKIDHFRCMPSRIFKVLEKKIGEHLLIEIKKK